jgi:hypothetical protein
MNTSQFILAGNAYFTVKNLNTGNRFSYRVSSPKSKAPVHFVSVLTGPDNTNDYIFIGTIFNGSSFRHSKKSRITSDAQSVKVFSWFFDKFQSGTLPEFVTVYPEGRCGRCGRRLTVPESILTGIGPECVKTLAA